MKKMPRIYLDYAASTPVDRAVFDAMKPYFGEMFGNPGSVHSFGQEAIAAVDASRETVAKVIGAEFREIVFTGSATEANNLALRGITHDVKRKMVGIKKPRIIVSAIEHESILETARALEKEGVEVIYLPVDKNGVVDLRVLETSLNDRTVLVSVMYANNEIGTVQPIAEIAEIISRFRNIETSKYPLFHTDAVQAFQFLDCNVNPPSGGLGVDMMTLSAHKIYGPKGIGALYISDKLQVISDQKRKTSMSHVSCLMSPILTGGGQEFGMRSGTENVPSIVGFAKAIEISSHLLIQSNEQMNGLREHLWRGIKKIIPKAEINGVPPSRSSVLTGTPAGKPISNHLLSLPNILNVYFPGHEAQDVLTRLDLRGIAASSGSACRTRALEASYVIAALGYPEKRAKASIRFSLGRPTTKKEIDEVIAVLKGIL